jgi:NADH-quinone oxidoreductase subunit C
MSGEGAAISLRATLANSKWAGTACPHCQQPITAGEPAVLCPACFTPHHATCWRANENKCAKDGTAARVIEPRGRGAPTVTEAAPTPPPAAKPPAATPAAAKPAAPPKPAAPAAAGRGAGPNIREAPGLRPMEGVKARLSAALDGFTPAFGVAVDEVTVTVDPAKLPDAARILKDGDGLKFDYLRCLSGVDYQAEGIEVAYHLFSTRLAQKCVLKTRLSGEGASVGTVTGVWAGANWHERETAEMFNVRFEGHPYPEPLLLERDETGRVVPGPILLKRFKLRPKEPPAQFGFPEEE